MNADGSIALTVQRGGLTVRVAEVAMPWAVDAAGIPVPTRYVIQGSTIVQEVEHLAQGVTYPVVADPTISLGWYVYINYSSADVKRYWSGSTYLNQAAAAAACAVISNVYGVAACAALTAGWFQSIGDTFAEAKRLGRGVQLGLTYVGFIPVRWNVV